MTGQETLKVLPENRFPDLNESITVRRSGVNQTWIPTG